LNLNQQSESSDLLGGFKPVEIKSLCTPLKNQFEKLFPRTFSRKKNSQMMDAVLKSFQNGDWVTFLDGLKAAVKFAEDREMQMEQDAERKSRKTLSTNVKDQWQQLAAAITKFEVQQNQVRNNFAFSFVEGSLVKAVRNGSWVLLDEINLASAETLESLR
jgi:midasin